MHPESLERSLGEHPFVAGMRDVDVAFLAGCTKNVRFSPGDYLFHEGGAADTLFVLRDGKVALESHAPGRGTVVLETLGATDVIGWSTLFEPYRWDVDGRAIESTLAFAVDGRCLRGKLDADAPFGYALTKRLLLQVHRRLEQARLRELDVYRGKS